MPPLCRCPLIGRLENGLLDLLFRRTNVAHFPLLLHSAHHPDICSRRKCRERIFTLAWRWHRTALSRQQSVSGRYRSVVFRRIFQRLLVTIDAPITHASRGFAGHVDLAVPLLHAGKNEIVLTGTAHAATGRYMQTFYGVTDAQAASSGFRPYSLTGGFHSASMSIAWTHAASRHWSVLEMAGTSRIFGRYGDSPIVQARSNYFGGAGINYRF